MMLVPLLWDRQSALSSVNLCYITRPLMIFRNISTFCKILTFACVQIKSSAIKDQLINSLLWLPSSIITTSLSSVLPLSHLSVPLPSLSLHSLPLWTSFQTWNLHLWICLQLVHLSPLKRNCDAVPSAYAFTVANQSISVISVLVWSAITAKSKGIFLATAWSLRSSKFMS